MNVLRKFVLLVLLLAAMRAGAQTQVVGLPAGRVDGDVEVSGKVAVGPTVVDAKGVYNAGIKCDGTDESTAFLARLAAVVAAGGGTITFPPGTCRIDSQILIPNDGAEITPNQPALRFTGAGASATSAQSGTLTNGYANGGTILDLRYAGTVAKIVTLGQGKLEIDHLSFKESGATTSTPFIFTSNTTLHVHDVGFYGSTAKYQTQCDQDAIVLGGTTAVFDPTANSPFQGYGTVIENNFADRIRRLVYGQVYANGVQVVNNTVFIGAGSNATTPIGAATNAAAAVLTVTGHGLSTGNKVTVSGFTGNWAALNGVRTITVVNANTFSVPIDSTAFGEMTGTPAILSGAAIEFDAGTGGQYDAGNYIGGNLIEIGGYPYAIKIKHGVANLLIGNHFYDEGPVTIGYHRFEATSMSNFVLRGMASNSYALVSEDTGSSGQNFALNYSGTTLQLQGGVSVKTGNGIQWPNWLAYETSGNFYIRDLLNSVMAIYCTPSAAHAGVCVFDGGVTVNGTGGLSTTTLTTSGGANFGTWINFKNGGNYVGFSDNGVTEKWRITGATGDIATAPLKGTGNAFVCADANGKLYRSSTACN